MTVSLHTFVSMYDRALETTAHVLEKGAAHAASQGEDPEAILTWRLVEDMHPLAFQVRIVVNFAGRWLARAAAVAEPEEIGEDLDLDGYRAAIAETRTRLAGLDATAFADRDEAPLEATLGNGMNPTLPVEQWITGFATTNVYFHMSMIYAILRARGVPLGKVDLFPSGL